MTRLFISTWIVLFVCLMFTPAPSSAQVCGTVTSHTYSNPYISTVVTTPEVKIVKEAVPVAVPLLVPSTVFQYLPAITPTPVVASTPAVTAPVTQPVASKPAASNVDIEKLVNEKVEALLRDKISNSSDGMPPPIKWGALSHLKDTVPVSTNTSPSNSTIDPNTAFSLLKTHCASCHGGGKKAGGVIIFDADGRYAPNTTAKAIVDSITSGSMPKNNPDAISKQDQILLQKWASQ